MQCPQYRDALQDLADGTLGPIRGAELRRHLDTCAACRELADDLRVIHETAASLDELPAPDGVWLQIAGRLRQEGRVVEPARGTATMGRHRAALLAIAAALVLMVGASLVMLLRSQSTTEPAQQAAAAPGNGDRTDAVQTIADEIRLAEQHYQNAIAKLEEVAKLDADSGETTFDPQTAAALQRSLTVIDQAIAESRAALRTEPQSVPARASLFDALKQKVTLLQDTVVLMNEMRKGNAAGAAQVIEGLNKS